MITRPYRYLTRMAIFLVVVGAVCAVLFPRLQEAFAANAAEARALDAQRRLEVSQAKQTELQAQIESYELDAKVTELDREIEALDADRRAAAIEARIEPALERLRRLSRER